MRGGLAVVAGILLGIVYGFLMLGFFGHSAIYDPHKYRYANDWTGLNFLLDPPLTLIFFIPLFIIASVLRSVGMFLGILFAGFACLVFLHFFHPADYSLPNESSRILILSWGLSSVVCAGLGPLVPLERMMRLSWGLLSVACAWLGHLVPLERMMRLWPHRTTRPAAPGGARWRGRAGKLGLLCWSHLRLNKEGGIIRVAVICIAVSLMTIAGVMVLRVVQDHRPLVQTATKPPAAAVAAPRDDLSFAISRGDATAVQALLDKGVEVNAKNNAGGTALMRAAAGGHPEVVQVLLDKGAEVNAKDASGETAVISAAAGGHREVLQMLLAEGAEVNGGKVNDGWTALMLASARGHLDVVQVLLDKGAEVNAKAHNGWTALMVARDVKVKALLLQAGAKP